jgi:redox-sensitive bicupin YhaK (pirin superfamily)
MNVIAQRIAGRERDLGGFSVRRILPAAGQRMVGPFVFLDHIGPIDLPPGPHINVRPHPHIGLATVTYLFSGEMLHRDSLGSLQEVHAGDVNWMTAGRGIVHSERSTPRALRERMHLHGLQSWVALPDGREDDPPAFAHHPLATLPQLDTPDGARLRIVAGEAFGRRSPVATPWPTLYVDAALQPGSSLELPPEHEQRAIYVASGALEVDGEPDPLRATEMAVLAPDTTARLRAIGAARVMLLGGAAFAQPRELEWNFVASTRERLEAAKRDWRERNLARFPQVPGDELEFIPLPGG